MKDVMDGRIDERKMKEGMKVRSKERNKMNHRT